jgi:tetratricopeptide (TPR) repeat protein/GGDEF domain-containing protein
MVATPYQPNRAEITKLVERAEKLLQKGKTADALEEYLQILSLDRNNDAVRQMAADLCLSMQRVPEAVNLLGEMFERQIQAGDATRGSLTYKKLARYAKPTWQQRARFGQLLEGSNRKLAIETYESALEELLKQEDKANSLNLLKRIVILDSSERNLLRLGELSSQAGDTQSAAAAFLKLGQLAESSGGTPAPYFERAYTENPADPQIALAYGRSLIEQNQAGSAIFVLEPHLKTDPPSREIRENYGRALLTANRLTEAEPYIWEIFEQNPSRLPDLSKLIGLFIDNQQDAEAVALARKLEQLQRRRGERKSFAAMMQDIVAAHRPSPEVLEFLGELFNSSNRENDYAQTLLKLFDLYYGMGNYAKAAECLDRAAEVDMYEPGHQKRLGMLRGTVDDKRYQSIASRFNGMGKTTNAAAASTEATPAVGAAALQDLILQAEILVQYGMKSKALERLQRIQELFPHEEERNEDLQRLYLAAGLTPKYPEGSQAPAKPAPAAAVAAPPPAPVAAPASDVSSFTRVADISRKLYRQGNAEAVMATTVNEIGAQWNASRCIVALRKPGLSPTAMTEYCGAGVPPGAPSALSKIIVAAHDVAMKHGTLNINVADAHLSAELEGVHATVTELAIGSLLALPLSEGKDQMGVLILTQDGPRTWSSNDLVVLRTISEQIVIALNNAGLRRLVKNLSVTDEGSGLLRRASYLNLLLSETGRAQQQKNALSLVLMQFGKSSTMLKELGESTVESTMQQIGQLLKANLRQNDLAFRYDTTTVALVLGENEKEAEYTVEKLRKLIAEIRIPGSDEALPFSAGLAQAVVRPEFDAVDVVTEVINRVEQALDASLAAGPGRVVAQAASMTTAAVA